MSKVITDTARDVSAIAAALGVGVVMRDQGDHFEIEADVDEKVLAAAVAAAPATPAEPDADSIHNRLAALESEVETIKIARDA